MSLDHHFAHFHRIVHHLDVELALRADGKLLRLIPHIGEHQLIVHILHLECEVTVHIRSHSPDHTVRGILFSHGTAHQFKAVIRIHHMPAHHHLRPGMQHCA